jgi:hypothetical protein
MRWTQAIVILELKRTCSTARAGNRRFWLLSTLHTHAKAPYKNNLLWETLRALNHPGKAQTGEDAVRDRAHVDCPGSKKGVRLAQKM